MTTASAEQAGLLREDATCVANGKKAPFYVLHSLLRTDDYCRTEKQLPMTHDHQTTIALHFNACINTRDLAGLAALLTDDHTFIDAANTAVHGKHRVVEAWQGFFALFPDYRNLFDRVESRQDLVAIMGCSTCSEPQLDGPALWTAKVRGDQVAEWRVYTDTPANRLALSFR